MKCAIRVKKYMKQNGLKPDGTPKWEDYAKLQNLTDFTCFCEAMNSIMQTIPPSTKKEDLPAIICASLKTPDDRGLYHRTKVNMDKVYLLGIDYDATDGQPSQQEVIDRLDASGLNYIRFGSPSYCPAKPKMRIFIPLETPVDASEWSHNYETNVEAILGKKIADGQCKDASRLFYIPQADKIPTIVTKTNGKNYIFVINPKAEIPTERVAKAFVASCFINGETDLRKKVMNDIWYNKLMATKWVDGRKRATCYALAGLAACFGIDLAEATRAIVAVCPTPDDSNVQLKAIEDGYAEPIMSENDQYCFELTVAVYEKYGYGKDGFRYDPKHDDFMQVYEHYLVNDEKLRDIVFFMKRIGYTAKETKIFLEQINKDKRFTLSQRDTSDVEKIWNRILIY